MDYDPWFIKRQTISPSVDHMGNHKILRSTPSRSDPPRKCVLMTSLYIRRVLHVIAKNASTLRGSGFGGNCADGLSATASATNSNISLMSQRRGVRAVLYGEVIYSQKLSSDVHIFLTDLSWGTNQR